MTGLSDFVIGPDIFNRFPATEKCPPGLKQSGVMPSHSKGGGFESKTHKFCTTADLAK